MGGSKEESTHTLAIWHWHQKVMVAMPKTVASNVSFRSKPCLRAVRWVRVTGAHFGWLEAAGAADFEPCTAHLRRAAPFQGAPLMTCHNWRSKSQVLRVLPPMAPVPLVVVNTERSHSGAGICNSLGMLKVSQNWVNLRRLAP